MLKRGDVMKWFKLIMVFIVTIIGSQFLGVNFVKDNHFNIITINSVLIGFLFTSLSILLGFLDKRIIKYFQQAGALKDVYSNIEKGIVYSFISIAISLINLIVVEEIIVNKFVIKSMYGFEIIFLLLTLISLLKTLKNIKILIDSIKIDNIKEVKEENLNKEASSILAEYKQTSHKSDI